MALLLKSVAFVVLAALAVAAAQSPTAPCISRRLRVLLSAAGDAAVESQGATAVNPGAATGLKRRRIVLVAEAEATGEEKCQKRLADKEKTIDILRSMNVDLTARLQGRLNATSDVEKGLRRRLEEQEGIIAQLKASNDELKRRAESGADCDIGEEVNDQKTIIANLTTTNEDLQKNLEELKEAHEATQRILDDRLLLETYLRGNTTGVPTLCPPSAAAPTEDPTALSEKLLIVAADGRVDAIQELLDAGADVAYRNVYGWTALGRVASFGHLEALRFLLGRGAPLGAATQSGDTPLHLAARYGRARCAEDLAAAGADVEARNRFGRTPLHVAALQGDEGAVRAVLAAGAHRDVRDNDGKLPRDLAHNAAVRDLLSPSE